MQLMRIDLHGFRRLTNRSYTFKPGFNLVYGPNEAGKTTLQQSVLALLYSLYDEGIITSEQRERARDIQPWDEDATFGGELVYRLDGGQRYNISRVFGPIARTTLTTLPASTDVTGDYEQLSDGRVLFANEQFGVDKQFFEKVCVVGQAELTQLSQESLSLNDAIVRIFASVSNDVTINDALDLLNAALQDRVGTERTRTRPLPAARARLERIEADIAANEARRAILFNKMAERRDLHEQLTKLHEDTVVYEYQHKLALRQMYGYQLNRADDWQQEAEQYANEMDTLDKWANFPDELYDQLLELTARRGQLRSIIADYPEMGETAAERHAAWQTAADQREAAEAAAADAQIALQELEDQLAAQAGAETLTRLGRDGVNRLRQQITAAHTELAEAESAHQMAETAWNNIQMTETQFDKLASQVEAVRERMENQSRGLTGVFRRPVKPSEEEETALATYEEAKAIYDDLERARIRLNKASASFAIAVKGAADQLGVTTNDDIDEAAFTAVAAECDRCAALLEDITTRRAALRAAEDRLASATEAVEALLPGWDESKQQLYTVEAEIQALLDEADIKSDMDEAVALFREGRSNRSAWQRAKERYDRLQRDLALAQAEIAQATAAIERLDADLDELRAVHPELADLEVSGLPQEYDEQLNSARAGRETLRDQIDSLTRDIDTLRPQVGSSAHLEEAAAETRRTIHQLEQFGAALDIAVTELEAATREFQDAMVPRLETLMSENLAQATQGRYSAVKINPATLTLRLVSPETNAPVDTGLLSTSTQDLIYLLFRLSIVQFISTTGERLPVLLDDPLVHYDEERRTRTLEVLLALADRMQIVMFTQDGWTRDWVADHCEDCIITLERAPSAAS